jgi:hypothetical protein
MVMEFDRIHLWSEVLDLGQDPLMAALHYVLGYSQGDLSELLGLSLTSVRNHLADPSKKRMTRGHRRTLINTVRDEGRKLHKLRGYCDLGHADHQHFAEGTRYMAMWLLKLAELAEERMNRTKRGTGEPMIRRKTSVNRDVGATVGEFGRIHRMGSQEEDRVSSDGLPKRRVRVDFRGRTDPPGSEG